MPAGETLYAVNPDFQPVFFYVKARIQYVSYLRKLPANAHYFLVQTENEAEATTTRKFAPRHAYPLVRVQDYHKREMIIFEIGP